MTVIPAPTPVPNCGICGKPKKLVAKLNRRGGAQNEVLVWMCPNKKVGQNLTCDGIQP